jgi:rRNA-processing protein FCF1
MLVVFDADALIKLNRIGILEQVAQSFQCVIPQQVYEEAVVKGRERGYADAEEIDRIVSKAISVGWSPVEVGAGLQSGAGERAALALANELGRQSIIISDDTPFLRQLKNQGVLNATPAALIVNMVERDVIPNRVAARLVEALRPHTRATTIDQALQDLEQLGK